MTDPNAWHSVRAIGGPAMTIMVTGPHWTRSVDRVPDDEPIPPLSEAEITAMLGYYRQRARR